MAIQPIDLQALFAHSGTVGKIQAAIREGQQMQAALQQAQAQQKQEENVRTVNEAQDIGKDVQIKSDAEKGDAQTNEGGTKGKAEQSEEVKTAEQKNTFFRNPALGRNLDISG